MAAASKKINFVENDNQMAIQLAKSGLDFFKKNNYKFALRYFKKAYKLPIKKELASLLLLHMANIMGEMNLLDQQQIYIEELFEIDVTLNNIELLLDIYQKTNNEIKIKELATKIKSISVENDIDEKKAIDLLLKAKDFNEAIERLKMWLEKNFDDEDSMKKLLNTYIQSSRYEEAYDFGHVLLEKGLEKNFLLELASMEKELFDFEKCKDYTLQHLDIHKENVIGVNIVAHTLMTNASYNGTLNNDEYIYWANRAMLGTKPGLINSNIERNLNPFRKIRVGFISYDLRKHSVGKFILSLFAYINEKPGIETYCYYTHPTYEDGFTSVIKDVADVFKSVGMYSNKHLQKELLNDELDVLIDLNGQSSGTKLPLIAERYAPIQMTWMGFPFSSFYYNIDYIIGDYYIDDDEGETEKYCTEKILKMDPCYMCFSMMPEDMYIEPDPPQTYNGYITFGMMNNPLKYSVESIKIWQKCLETVPESRLLIQLSKFGPGFVQNKLIERFIKYGLDINRVDFGLDFGQNGYYRTYNKCDIMLDTLPFGGGTTTPEALWMGVPVIGCKYHMRHGRMAYSFMSNVGLGHLCADSIDTYHLKIKEVAQDITLLKDLRMNLREKLKTAPLFDRKLFRLGFENAIRGAFVNHCFRENSMINFEYYYHYDNKLLHDCIRAGEILISEASKNIENEECFIYLLNKYIEIHDYLLFRLHEIYKDKIDVISTIKNIDDMLEILTKPNDIDIIINIIKLVGKTINSFA